MSRRVNHAPKLPIDCVAIDCGSETRTCVVMVGLPMGATEASTVGLIQNAVRAECVKDIRLKMCPVTSALDLPLAFVDFFSPSQVAHCVRTLTNTTMEGSQGRPIKFFWATSQSMAKTPSRDDHLKTPPQRPQSRPSLPMDNSSPLFSSPKPRPSSVPPTQKAQLSFSTLPDRVPLASPLASIGPTKTPQPSHNSIPSLPPNPCPATATATSRTPLSPTRHASTPQPLATVAFGSTNKPPPLPVSSSSSASPFSTPIFRISAVTASTAAATPTTTTNTTTTTTTSVTSTTTARATVAKTTPTTNVITATGATTTLHATTAATAAGGPDAATASMGSSRNPVLLKIVDALLNDLPPSAVLGCKWGDEVDEL
eukprot:gnl/Spiro4/11482_TR6066_c0_g2_i1.p1 gnl/Spiro4/11482_TR6066_c0_g2~~gnl/Spiro4/11482_TR6066_c0_g2_i1.p1  ORF type:complete len:370 (-),score=78.34 gnl/Spiro4/11482_TR6066_c0_g2_i1:4-1113(-)